MTPSTPANGTLRQLIDGYRQTALIHAAVKLGIPDALAAGPLDAAALGTRLALDSGRLERLLRGLCLIGIVSETGPTGAWILTELGAGLCTGAPGALGEAALLAGGEYAAAWNALPFAVRSGETAFDHVFGMNAWEHRRQNPALGRAFQSWLHQATAGSAGAIVRALEFGDARTVADIGGGQGGLLRAVLEKHSHMTGLLVDLPHVVEAAAAGFAATDTMAGGRCRFVGADFFSAVPEGADVYLLKSVLHDWSDDLCIKILVNCRRAMEPASRLIIVERLLPERTADDPFVVMQDLHMLAVLGGKERSAEEFKQLAAAAGLAWRRGTPTDAGLWLLEFVAAA